MRIKNKRHSDVIKLYPTFPIKKIMEMTGLTASTIHGMARTEGINRVGYYWTESDLRFLLDNYEQYGWRHCCDKLNKSEFAVKNKFRQLKGKRKQNKGSNHGGKRR